MSLSDTGIGPRSIAAEEHQGESLRPYFEDDSFLAGVIGREGPDTAGLEPREARRAEKEFLAERFRLPREHVFMLEQVHGSECLLVDETHTAANGEPFFARGDALLTRDADLLLCIRTADCLPIFFTGHLETPDDIAANRIAPVPVLAGIVHAGWRGLRAGILETALERARESGCGSFRLFRGPCIGGDAYEVGPEVAEHFEIKTRNHANRERETWLLDLCANAAGRLESAPVFADHSAVFAGELDQAFQGCVFRENHRWYSHRRGDSGRNLNFIMLKGGRTR